MSATGIPKDVTERVIARRGKLHMFDTMVPAKTALIVVDLQNYFMEEGAPAEVPAARDIVPEVNRLAGALRAAGGTVVWIKMTQRPEDAEGWSVFYDYVVPGERGRAQLQDLVEGAHLHDLWPALEVADGDLIVNKHRFSAFLPESSDLAAQLRSRGIDTVVVTGTLTNVCCHSTALDAMMMNFRTIMVADANATRTDDIHIRALSTVQEIFGDVRTTDEVVALLTAGAGAQAAE